MRAFRPLLKDALREIRRTAGRFVSMLLMIAVGCGIFTGLRVTSPAMLSTASEYITDCLLMDLRLRSNIGVKSSEIAAVRSAEGVKGACAGYTKELYYFDDGRSVVVKAFSIPENIAADSKNFLNRPYIVEGRLPAAKDECAVELGVTSPADFAVGNTITLASPAPENDPLEKTLSRDSFMIVGVVISPMFIGCGRDAAAVGDGDVNSNIYIPESDFTCDYYTDMYVTLELESGLDPFSEEYRQAVIEVGRDAEKAFSESLEARYDKLVSDAERKIKSAESSIEQSEGVLAADENELAEMLAEARETAESTERQYGGSDSLFARAAVARSKKSVEMLEALVSDESGDVRREYREELDAAYNDLAEAKAQLEEAPTLAVYHDDRFSYGDYSSYRSDAEKVSGLANAFPPFFVIVAALVCVTAMTRMTKEQRVSMGTYKALGFSGVAVFMRFSVYGTLAALVGSTAGAAVGMNFIPPLIIGAYNALYNIPAADGAFSRSYMLWSAAVSVLLVNAAAAVSCRKALAEQAGSLMRPEPPLNGHRVIAERAGFIWSRLGFISKVTLRNMFRFKKRALMTIVGAAGSAALITAGFGLRSTVEAVTDKQFGEIFVFSAIASLDSAKGEEAAELFDSTDGIDGYVRAVMKNVTAGNVNGANGEKSCAAYLVAMEGSLDGVVELHDADGNRLSPKDGAVVTKKMAELCGISIGGSVDVTAPDGKTASVTVTGIAENYALNFVYMEKSAYERIFSDRGGCNVAYLKFSDGADSSALKRELIADERIIGVTLVEDMRDSYSDSAAAMDAVVLLMLFCAMLLAITVLYNLSDINITERRRELATIKVLGFYDNELRAYVSREMLLLTAAGIIPGLALGKLLHMYAVRTVEADSLSFPRGLPWQPYLYGAALTVLFSLIVNAALGLRLKKIGMAETLKSVE